MTNQLRLIAVSVVAVAIIGLTLFSVHFFSKFKSNGPPETLDHLQMTFTQLAQVQNALNLNVCEVPVEQLSEMNQRYQKLLKERYQKEHASMTEISFFPSDCHATCSCRIYVGFFESSDGDGILIGPKFTEIWDSYTQQLAQQVLDPERCRPSTNWVCKSDLLKLLQTP